jgi:serine protease Do
MRSPAFRYGAGFALGALFVVLLLQGAGFLDARTEAQTATGIPFDVGRGFSTVAKQVSAAVVNINTEQVVQQSRRQDDPFSRFFGFDDPFHPFDRAPRDRRSLGSGFVIDPSGYILTNNHVVERATKIRVGLHDGRTMDASVVGTDPETDLAVVRIKASNLPSLRLAAGEAVEVGDWVLAFGSPFGLEETMTAGIISAKGRVIGAGRYDNFLQTDAAINPGNSGGPLVNLKGEVVGINTIIMSQSGGFEGVGFAIPADLAKGIYGQLVKTGKVTRGWLGVQIQELTPELARAFKLSQKNGVVVSQVEPGSPAARAGIQTGDVIVDYNGKRIESYRDLSLAVANTAVGTPAKIKLMRQGQPLNVELNVGELPVAEAQGSAPASGGDEPGRLGLALSNLTPEIAARLGITGTEGAVVTEVRSGSPADDADIQTGDVIKEVNQRPVKTAAEVVAAIKGSPKGSTVLFRIERQGRSMFLAVEAP